MVEERAHVVSLVTEGAADEIVYFSLEYDYIHFCRNMYMFVE